MDVQSIAALTIVAATIVVMGYFKFKKKAGSCGEDCGCGAVKSFSKPSDSPKLKKPS